MNLKARQLRALLAQNDIVVAPGAFDAWSARLIEQQGMPAVYMTGFGASASLLGVPDLGIITGTEMAEQAGRITQAVGVPVIADADTGFGDVHSIARTVRRYESAGVAAIQIEDQVSPKKCGHMDDKRVVDTAEMVVRLRATCEARDDPDTLVIARTDARATHDLDEALRRGDAYLSAGADILFIEAPRSDEELERICRTFAGVPLLANVVEGGKTPYHSVAELREIGFCIAIFPISALLAATRAVVDAVSEIATDGRLSGRTPTVDFEQFNRYMGLENYLRNAARFVN